MWNSDRRRPVRGAHASVRTLMRVCADIVERIPSRHDGVLEKAVKVAAIGEAVRKRFYGEESAIASFARYNHLAKSRHPQFVHLFFASPLATLFETARINIDEYTQILRASHPRIGALYFTEHHYGTDHEVSPEVLHDEHLDFADVLDELWRHFDGGINVSIERAGYHPKLRYGALAQLPDAIYGSAARRLDAFLDKHGRYRRDGLARAYLLAGPPGTGKSTMVRAAAARIGGRTLRIEAKSLESLETEEVRFLLRALAPACLIIDDVDKIHFESCLPTLLTVLEWVRLDHPEVALMFTANTVELPSALKRPGRIDEIVWFDMPNDADQRAILEGYLRQLEVSVDAATVDLIIAKSRGLAAAWLKELAIQLRYEPPERVAAIAEGMQQLSSAPKEAPPTP
jgi:hypothetical protein